MVLAKPETYMNLSGIAVRELVREYEAQPEQDLVLLYDEIDLPFGPCGFGLVAARRGTTGWNR